MNVQNTRRGKVVIPGKNGRGQPISITLEPEAETRVDDETWVAAKKLGFVQGLLDSGQLVERGGAGQPRRAA